MPDGDECYGSKRVGSQEMLGRYTAIYVGRSGKSLDKGAFEQNTEKRKGTNEEKNSPGRAMQGLEVK